MSSRENILAALREAPRPFAEASVPPDQYLHMAPHADQDLAELRERFVAEAEKLSCVVHQPATPGAAIEILLELLGEDKTIISWDLDHIPLPGLKEALAQAGIAPADAKDPNVRVGVSGADALLAATGSLVLCSGRGKLRTASLLPPVHVAVATQSQLLPDLESWLDTHEDVGKERLRQASNVVVISGPSRTADIAMQLILGMHGPGELHIILLA